jgi:hypothetical protein
VLGPTSYPARLYRRGVFLFGLLGNNAGIPAQAPVIQVTAMPPCLDCDALLDQPATAEPHANLKGAAVYTAHAAVLERYTCNVCRSIWDRWTARNPSASYRWKRLVAVDE